MDKKLSLPLYKMPNGTVVDLREVWAVERISDYDGYGDTDSRFAVYFKKDSESQFGQRKWLELQRKELIENWREVL